MIFYSIGLQFFHFLVWVVSFFNAKAKLFVGGRKQSFAKLSDFNKSLGAQVGVYWFHCASLGEFEQARPLIEKIKKDRTDIKIALSFFSPSGYEIQKSYALADIVFYLPKATRRNANAVLNLLKPQQIFFIKYEFWLNYLNEAHHRGISLYLVSALFDDKQIFFQWYGKIFFEVLSKYSKIFVQDELSFQLLQKHHIPSIVSGDTRFDRVLANKERAQKNELIALFAGEQRIVVLGSSWRQEEEFIFNAYDSSLNYKIILAPHDIKRRIEVSGKLKSIRYSEATKENITDKEVLIIDNIGMLASLYSYATIAFIGGGYRGALHNILEAAVFGMPVLYGYKTQKHPEAEALQDAGGGIIIHTKAQLSAVLHELLTKEEMMRAMGDKARNFIEKQSGAVKQILTQI